MKAIDLWMLGMSLLAFYSLILNSVSLRIEGVQCTEMEAHEKCLLPITIGEEEIMSSTKQELKKYIYSSSTFKNPKLFHLIEC